MTKSRAWKFRLGSDENVIRDVLNHGTIHLDYGTPGLRPTMTRDELFAALRFHNPDRPDKGVRAHAGQIDALLNRVTKGDLALVPRDRGRLMMIGEIISDQPSVSKTMIEVRVRWIAPDLPVSRFDQDLQYSFMAIHKFCEVSRNEAPRRIMKICLGEADPGY